MTMRHVFAGLATFTFATLVAAADPAPVAIADFSKPLQFSYGAWEKKAVIEKETFKLAGVSNKGGGGTNCFPPVDLSAHAAKCPTITVKVGKNNKPGVLRLLLRDDKEQGGTFQYELPTTASDKAVVLFPKEGALLSKPNEPGDKEMNLKGFFQWQLLGDYQDEENYDLEITAIELREPAKKK
jgi:hypothetical protein